MGGRTEPRRMVVTAVACGLLASSLALAGSGFSIADASVSEGDTSNPMLNFGVTLQACGAPPPGCSVTVATQNGMPASALAGVDYVPLTQVLMFSNGPAGPPQTLTFGVTLLSDQRVELNETFNAILLNPVGAGIDDNVATGTIVNDDSAIVTGIGLAQIFEGDNVDINFVMASTVDVDVQLTAEIVAGTADGEDYSVVSVNGTFLAGETIGRGVRVNATEDQLVELDESFQATIVSIDALGRAVTIHPTSNSSPVLIRNEDSALIEVVGVSDLEGDLGVTPFSFLVSLSQPVDTSVEVFYTTNDGTATAGTGDYGAEASSVILSGTTQVAVVIDVNGDEDVEPDEAFLLDLLSFDADGRDVSFGDVTAIGTILNDDGSGLIFSDGFESGGTEVWSQ